MTYTIQFILTIYINSEKLMLPGRSTLFEFFSWKCGNWEKQQKVATPLLFDHSEQDCLVLYPETKYHDMKLQSLMMFKTTKDMFYKKSELICELTGPIMGLRKKKKNTWFFTKYFFFCRLKCSPFHSKQCTENWFQFLQLSKYFDMELCIGWCLANV